MTSYLGNGILGGDEDPFEGLTPEEIEAYVRSKVGLDRKESVSVVIPKLEEEDEFDGMSPEEINEAVKRRAKAQS